ncbi:MAG: uroporphyrinogen decarboxylase family protein [Candidatus Bathyarchaeia archaeon]
MNYNLLEYIRDPRIYRENYLRSIEMRRPWWIPCSISFSQATWSRYREALEDLLASHPSIFPDFKKGSVRFDDFGLRRRGNRFVDPWGCVWLFLADGLQGQVVEHPLRDWSMLKDFNPPDPDEGIPVEGGSTIPWSLVEDSVRSARIDGRLAMVNMPHGFFFQRLYYLRGFQELMKDIALEDERLYKLIGILEEYYMELARRIARLKPDIVYFGDDLGMQYRMPISPEKFRRLIYPSYRRIFGFLRGMGIHVYLHSDGHVVEVMDQLLDSGISVLNIQDRVNGLDNIARICRGRVCVALDIDRQKLLPFGTPSEIRSHLEEAVRAIASRSGGLMFVADVYPDVPLENIEALCRSLEEVIQLHLELT